MSFRTALLTIVAALGLMTGASAQVVSPTATPVVLPTAIDYRCLNLCVANGNSGHSCLANCTYSVLPNTPPSRIQGSSNHAQFSTPIPVGDTIIVSPNSPTTAAPSNTVARTVSGLAPQTRGPIDAYQCVRQCTSNGMQYGYCVQGCQNPK